MSVRGDSPTERTVLDASSGGGSADSWSIIAIPYAKDAREVLGGGDGFSSEGRKPVCTCQLGYSIPDETHRHNEDRVRDLEESVTEGASPLERPVPCQLTAASGDDTFAEANEVKIRGC